MIYNNSNITNAASVIISGTKKADGIEGDDDFWFWPKVTVLFVIGLPIAVLLVVVFCHFVLGII